MRWLLALVALVTGCAAQAATPTPLPARVVPFGGEPSVWHNSSGWHMLYTTGWDFAWVGYATATNPQGPWVDRGKVLGGGAGGWSGQAARNSVLVDRGRVFVYFTAPAGGPVRVATGSDVRHLTVQPTPAMTGVPAVNTSVVRDGARFVMLFEAADPVSHWQIGMATGPTPAGPFTVTAYPIRSLQRSKRGAFGGPALTRTPAGWSLLYHAASNGDAAPVDLYRATSADLTHWTSRMIVRHPGGAWDQSSDAVEVDGWLFYCVVSNPRHTGYTTVVRG